MNGISGPCVVCDNIVSFLAPSCDHCGHPDAGKEAQVVETKNIANAIEEFEEVVAEAIQRGTD